MKCIKCGLENDNDVEFCKNCGSSLKIKVQAETNISNQSTNKINSKSVSSSTKTSSVSKIKSVNNSKLVTIMVIVLIVIIGVILRNSFFTSDNNSSTEQNNTPVTDKSNDYSKYTANVPRSDRDFNYYWNINTATFDKTKFDGKISVFGTIMKSKLTGKSLKDVGFAVVNLSSKNGSIAKLDTLNYDSKQKYYFNKGLLYRNNVVVPSCANVSVDFFNYQGNNSIYDDSTELYFNQNFISQDLNCEIVPYMENVDYSKLTIDDVIDNLGAPTYVGGRTMVVKDVTTTSGVIVFSYIYVYDDYVFTFEFVYGENKDLSLIGLTYEGIQKFNRPIETTNPGTFEKEVYETHAELLNYQQNKYLKAIEKK